MFAETILRKHETLTNTNSQTDPGSDSWTAQISTPSLLLTYLISCEENVGYTGQEELVRVPKKLKPGDLDQAWGQKGSRELQSN